MRPSLYISIIPICKVSISIVNIQKVWITFINARLQKKQVMLNWNVECVEDILRIRETAWNDALSTPFYSFHSLLWCLTSLGSYQFTSFLQLVLGCLIVRTLSIFHQLTWFFLTLAEHISVSEQAEEFVLTLQYYWVDFAGISRLFLKFW